MSFERADEDPQDRVIFPVLPAVAPLVCGIVMVALTRQPEYLLFVILSPVMVIGNFVSERQGRRPGKPQRAAAASVRGTLGLAVFLAGSSRPALRDEWRAHLAGESGHDTATWAKFRQALGFIASAARFRLQDTADLAWRPIDAVLASRTLSNLFVGGPVIVVLFAIVHHDGRFGLVTDIQDAGELGALLYGVIRTGRWWRGVKPPEPEARRARE